MKELPIYEQQIDNLLKMGAISKCKSKPGQFLSTYFLRKKPDGKFRFILNKRTKCFYRSPTFQT